MSVALQRKTTTERQHIPLGGKHTLLFTTKILEVGISNADCLSVTVLMTLW